MFWDVPERPDRVARARKFMIDVREPQESLPSMAFKRWRQIDPFLGAADSEHSKVDRLVDAAHHLDASLIDRTLAANEHQLYALNFWLGYVNEGGPLQHVDAIVDRACAAVRRAGLRLGVVYIPESRWLNQHYTAQQRADFIRNANLFSACADWIDMDAFSSFGYDNRYFANRYLVDNYPYAGWHDVSVAQRWIGEEDVQRRWQFFDPDHMSAAGAREFSRQMVPRLTRWTESGGDVQ
jgi:hypothetical protein